jgi:hypothetical protein
MKGVLKTLVLVIVVAAAVLVFSSVGYAASPAEECAAAGGTYTAAGPNSTCTMPGEPVGNSSNTKGGSETTGPGKSEPNSDTTVCTGVNNKPHTCP